MSKLIAKPRDKIGAAPGTLIRAGEQKVEQVQITALTFNKEKCVEHPVKNIAEAPALCEGPDFTWIDVAGLHDTTLIAGLGNYFAIHPLTQEDILSTTQRPEWEDFGAYL